MWCNCNTPPLTIPFVLQQNPFPHHRWQPQIHCNQNPISNLHWEIKCIKREILGAIRTMHNFTDDKLKHNAACRVIQATLTDLNDDLDCLVCDITELEIEIVWDNFCINQQQGHQQQGVIAFGDIF
jgi:hypothetical protein